MMPRANHLQETSVAVTHAAIMEVAVVCAVINCDHIHDQFIPKEDRSHILVMKMKEISNPTYARK